MVSQNDIISDRDDNLNFYDTVVSVEDDFDILTLIFMILWSLRMIQYQIGMMISILSSIFMIFQSPSSALRPPSYANRDSPSPSSTLV